MRKSIFKIFKRWHKKFESKIFCYFFLCLSINWTISYKMMLIQVSNIYVGVKFFSNKKEKNAFNQIRTLY